MPMDLFLATVMRVAAGILAIQAQSSPVDAADAMRWASAAVYHANQQGLDPFELVAIARNESDFQPNSRGPDGKDCGITQIRITYSRYSCRQLRRSPWLSFAEAARGLSAIQRRCLKKAPHDVTRCRLNSYNQGVRYLKRGKRARYWLRVTCFAEAARAGVVPRGNCRRAASRRDIARWVRPDRITNVAVDDRSNGRR